MAQLRRVESGPRERYQSDVIASGIRFQLLQSGAQCRGSVLALVRGHELWLDLEPEMRCYRCRLVIPRADIRFQRQDFVDRDGIGDSLDADKPSLNVLNFVLHKR